MPSIVIPSTLQTNTKSIDCEKVNSAFPPSPPPECTLLYTQMDETSLAWVSSMSEQILLHLDALPEPTCHILWDLGKRLKTEDGGDPCIRQAIQVIIYHCRASIYYHQKDWVRTIQVCRKCVGVSSSLPKIGLLQAQATSMLEQCLVRINKSHVPSSMMMVCALCSTEKRAMPVCAQCKSQPYCSIKCLKQDQVRHSSQCHR
ncbi:hypothetical protein BC941DRAFT_409479 [Chlamydoabsidia padenii]|nr:hypothetical protein BC941DRAFT_409479 [Chlamydoabsidia padenii]